MPQHLQSPPQQPPAIGQTAASGSASKREAGPHHKPHGPDLALTRQSIHPVETRRRPRNDERKPSHRQAPITRPLTLDGAARRSTTRRPRRSIAICARVRRSSRFVTPGTQYGKDDSQQHQGATPVHNFCLRTSGQRLPRSPHRGRCCILRTTDDVAAARRPAVECSFGLAASESSSDDVVAAGATI